MTTLSILECLLTGETGFLKLGTTQAEVESLLGKENLEVFTESNENEESLHLLCGCLSLGFTKQKLTFASIVVLHRDDFPVIASNCQLDTWGIDRSTTLPDVSSRLLALKMDRPIWRHDHPDGECHYLQIPGLFSMRFNSAQKLEWINLRSAWEIEYVEGCYNEWRTPDNRAFARSIVQ